MYYLILIPYATRELVQVIPQSQIFETKEELILHTLLDRHSRTILSVTKDEALTALKISENCNIPLSTVYRRLQLLRKLHFLHVSCTIRQDGKKLLSFQNKISGIDISWDQGQLQINTRMTQ
ncbi:MAG: helix-turn-helix transcriptional regulator [Thaumarchaeota archaeon]|nr:helix-turn-helix transcriptional regulator [Nitrososphaerota archaeon]